MLNIGENSSKYVKVWDTNFEGKFPSANISSSKKDKEGNWENSSWRASFFGNAKDKAMSLERGDTNEITQGGVTNKYDKENQKTVIDITAAVYNEPIDDSFFSKQNMKKVR